MKNSLAISFCAAIGILSVDQISARSDLTSAMAELGCRGLCVAKAKVCPVAPHRRGGQPPLNGLFFGTAFT